MAWMLKEEKKRTYAAATLSTITCSRHLGRNQERTCASLCTIVQRGLCQGCFLSRWREDGDACGEGSESEGESQEELHCFFLDLDLEM